MPAQPIRPIRIEGNIAYVPLSRGMEAIIDACDVPLVNKWTWSVQVQARANYACRADRSSGKQAYFLLHRVIMDAPPNMQVDHIDGDGLNNRRSNLRLATVAENHRNLRKPSNNTSGYKGVSWRKDRSKWRAAIRVDGRLITLGTFDCPQRAHVAYCEASARLHGEFGRVE
jgi:hypothetical protein